MKIIILSLLLFLLVGCRSTGPHRAAHAADNNNQSENPCTLDTSQCYSIQGVYSQLNCPGQHTDFIVIDDHIYFLMCWGISELSQVVDLESNK